MLQEEGAKLNLNTHNSPARESMEVAIEAGRKKSKDTREFEHGLVSWSLIAMGHSEVNEAGFLMTLNQVHTC